MSTSFRSFLWTENNLKTELFENDDLTIIMSFSCPNLFKRRSKITCDCCVLKLIWRSVDGKHLVRFQNESILFKFPSA